MICGLRAAVFAHMMLPDMALQWAAANTELTRLKEFREEASLFTVLGLDLSAGVHLAAKDQLLQEDLQALAALQPALPLAALSVKRLTSPACGHCVTLFDVPDILQQPRDLSADVQAQARPPPPGFGNYAVDASQLAELSLTNAPSAVSSQLNVFSLDDEEQGPLPPGEASPELESMLGDTDWPPLPVEHGRPSSAPSSAAAFFALHPRQMHAHPPAGFRPPSFGLPLHPPLHPEPHPYPHPPAAYPPPGFDSGHHM